MNQSKGTCESCYRKIRVWDVCLMEGWMAWLCTNCLTSVATRSARALAKVKRAIQAKGKKR